jgi:hypothetical protein
MERQHQYVQDIVESVESLFDDDSELKRYNWNEVDGTDFFTAFIKAGAYLFNEMTGNAKNGLEFTHIANQLIVQDLLENGASAIESDE